MDHGVALVRTEDDLVGAVRKALGLVGFANTGIRTVVIKPNLCYYWKASTGFTTDSRLVSAIIDVVRDLYGTGLTIAVAESDATAMRTRHAFQILGYQKLADEKKVELVNLSAEETVQETTTVNRRQMRFEIPVRLLHSDLFINVPKLKWSPDVSVTCAAKNVFGCIAAPRKIVYHDHLNEAIVGINKILKPKLTIVDGLVALSSEPVRMDLVMAGTETYSVDWVAAGILGFAPSKVQFLKTAIAEGVWSPKGVVTLGEDLASFRALTSDAKFFSSPGVRKMELAALQLYLKVVGDIAA
jgi:uncharacterized protein (DUF362 family)